MPSFLPPLAHTSHVRATPDNLLQLTFRVVFDLAEDTTGQWEIWTDLPAINFESRSIVPHGEWHAIAFHPVPTLKTDTPVIPPTTDILATERLIIPIAKPSSPPTGSSYTLAAAAVLPKGTDGRYAYTFRRSLPNSNEVHWLGGEGSNGVVDISPSADGPQSVSPEARKSGELIETPQEGFGLALSATDNLVEVQVFDLTTSSHPATVLNLTISQIPFQHAPFASYVETPTPDISALGSLYSAYATHDLQSLQIEEGSLHPKGDDFLSSSSEEVDVCIDQLLARIAASSIGVKITRARLLGQVPVRGVAPLVIIPGAGEGRCDPPTAFALFATASDTERSVDIDLSPFVKDSVPYALLPPGKQVVDYLPPAQKPVLQLLLAAGGSIAHTLRIVEFDRMPLAGGTKTLWIGAPLVKAVQHGILHETLDLSGAAVPIHTQQGEGPEAISDTQTDVTPDLDSSENNPKDSAEGHGNQAESENVDGIWLFLSLIGEAFLNILAWLFGPPSATSPLQKAPDLYEESDDETEDYETRTPVDERTPLLRSPQISRISNEFPPDSPNLATGDTVTLKGAENAISIDGLAALSRSNVNFLEENTSGHPRAYIRYTIQSSPSVTFLLPPNTDDLIGQVNVKQCQKNGIWVDIPIHVKRGAENECSQMTINAEGNPDEWQVEIEERLLV